MQSQIIARNKSYSAWTNLGTLAKEAWRWTVLIKLEPGPFTELSSHGLLLSRKVSKSYIRSSQSCPYMQKLPCVKLKEVQASRDDCSAILSSCLWAFSSSLYLVANIAITIAIYLTWHVQKLEKEACVKNCTTWLQKAACWGLSLGKAHDQVNCSFSIEQAPSCASSFEIMRGFVLKLETTSEWY